MAKFKQQNLSKTQDVVKVKVLAAPYNIPLLYFVSHFVSW